MQITSNLKEKNIEFRPLTFITPLLLAIITLILFVRSEAHLFSTIFVLLFVALSGIWLISRTSISLDDHKINILNYIFLFKLLFIVFILYAGWIPYLEQSNAAYGYDPQRYYFDAQMLAENGFNLSYLPSINYSGILFFYGVIFKVFGHNPIIPALFNSLLSLYAVTLIMKMGYLIKRTGRTWIIGLALAIPEVIWYDAITSRETLVMSLIVIAIMSVSSVLIKQNVFPKFQFIMALPCLALIGIVRTSMLVPILLSLVLLFFVIKSGFTKKLFGFILMIAVVGVIIIAPALLGNTGSYDFNYVSNISASVVAQNDLSQFTWSNNSIGQMFVAKNIYEAIAYAPIRLIFYIVAPLPSINFDFSSWLGWQNIAATISALLCILMFPIAVASLFHAFKKENRLQLIFHIPFWVVMLSIAVGNQIIQDRYRVMAIPLFFACAWIGLSDKEVKKKKFIYLWYIMLAIGMFSYLSIKVL